MRETEWYPAFDGGTTFTLAPDTGKEWGSTEYVSVIPRELPAYEGPYTVTPSAFTQTLATADLMCADDIVINPIPNNYGLITYDGTVITIS